MQTAKYETVEVQIQPPQQIVEESAAALVGLSQDSLTISAISRTRPVFHALKRGFDVVASLIGLLVASPVFLAVALAIKLEDPKGKALFKQPRFGYGASPFMMYKFRSMYNDAEELLKRLSPEQEEEWKKNFKFENDPRITKVGAFIRKTSLDEIPQLLNILKGDMSLVGPRPPLLAEKEAYGATLPVVMSVRPGLTGYWQAYGRGTITFQERIRMNLYYIENMSVALDVRIMAKTVVSVLKREGAV